MSQAVVQILADIPPASLRDFLQHVRSFDASHPGCHFRISVASDPGESARDISRMLEGLDPPIPVVAISPFPAGKG